MTTITKEFTFDAAHYLGMGYPGKCKNMHGHTYKMQVTVGSENVPMLNEFGMLFDFTDLKKIFVEHIEPLVDHQNLNETLNFQPTAELMAPYFASIFNQNLPKGLYVAKLDLWETPTSFATFIPDVRNDFRK